MMGEQFELSVGVMAHGGDAIGHYGGRAIFVPYAIPGERLTVELVEDRGRYARARIVEILDPSPARIAPPCPHFGTGRCGGCQWQHIEYSVEARMKALVVLDQFRRIGKFEEPPVLETIPDDYGWGYRNHVRFHIDAEGRPGFMSAQTNQVYAIDECMIIEPSVSQLFEALDMALPELAWMELRAGTETGDLMVVLQTVDEEPPSLEVDFPLSIVQVCHDGLSTPLIGLDYIHEVINGKVFRISPTSFYQVNTPQAARLVDLVMESLDLEGYEHIVDAYCGVGLFTAFLSEYAGTVTGIELNHDAVADARHNLAEANNVEILEGMVKDILPTLDKNIHGIVVDPPRSGLEREALDAIVAKKPTRITYVSCDPATLARDARRLVRDGYRLEWIQPVDLFPQTYHIECVALFTRD
ncbi:MAG: class I SAM-dependent RNA methyltransferase [Anaerolineae bacterium]|nr:class I SAM-dependent RNA methyltransferase [Anaerolineae bacterium]